MKKICFIILNGYEYGGSEKNVSDIINNLDDNFEVTLICSKENRISEIIENKVNMRIISIDRNLISFIYLGYLINKIKPDIVHLHAARAIFYGRVLVKLVNIFNKKSIKVISTIHGLYLPKKKDNFIIKKMFSLFSKYDFKTVAVSNYDRNVLYKDFGYKNNVEVIYNGVDVDYFCSNKETIGNTIGLVGRLSEQKNPLALLQLAKILDKKYKFLVYGDGPLRDNLISLSSEMGLSNIEYKGFVKNVREAYENIDLIISLSYSEGLPYSLIEAISMGIPIVSTDVGGVNEIVINGKNGFLVNFNDTYINEISKAIHEVNSNYLTYSKEARKKAFDFSIEEMLNKYINIYNECLEEI